jgi:hypothetical protein
LLVDQQWYLARRITSQNAGLAVAGGEVDVFSSKGSPSIFSTSQGRSDQDDRFLLPMIRVNMVQAP